MRINDNGIYRDMTPEEIEEIQKQIQPINYNDAVDNEIRKRYSVSQEFAILRQKDEKPEEYAEYYAYCEECKANVKRIIAETDTAINAQCVVGEIINTEGEE